uniref:Microsomal triglyceride transfer protein (inferred by orthology to a C. elegans protein) n=1 Tax=Anisakis simplex TaxID=6269 RepID=A0A0M3JTY3_ANISI
LLVVVSVVFGKDVADGGEKQSKLVQREQRQEEGLDKEAGVQKHDDKLQGKSHDHRSSSSETPAQDAGRTANKADEKKVEKLVTGSRAQARSRGGSTSMLLYEYEFVSETEINSNSDADKSYSKRESQIVTKLNATYAFDLTHYDKLGGILGRYHSQSRVNYVLVVVVQMIKCNSGPCDYDMPDLYVDFVQGGNNINNIFTNTSSKTKWNILLSAANIVHTPAISGGGDHQTVVRCFKIIIITPYGLCSYHFWRPEDKIFKRRVNKCSFDGIRNHSLIASATVHSYEHMIEYIQNAKMNADIAYIEADEKLHITSVPLKNALDMNIHTKTTLTMVNRTKVYVEPLCDMEETASECAESRLSLTKLGKSWQVVKQNLWMGLLKKIMEKYHKIKAQKRLDEVSENSDGSFIFSELVDAVSLATTEQLLETFEDKRNDPFLGVFTNALGSAGTMRTHRFARDVVLVRKQQFVSKYLESVALSTKLNDEVVDDIKVVCDEIQWLFTELAKQEQPIEQNETKKVANQNEDVDESKEALDHNRNFIRQIAFAYATLLNRFCKSSKSRLNACNNHKDKNVNEFIVAITKCDRRDVDCNRSALQILVNLPVAGVVPYASQFICSKDNSAQLFLQKNALKLLAFVETEFIETPVINKLLRIFRNACPLAQSTTDQTLTIDVLMNAVPEHASVDDYWKQLRKFKLFRNHYLHRSLKAMSNVYNVKIAESNNHIIESTSKTEFNNEIFKRSDFLISVRRQNGHQNSPVLALTVDTAGLANVVSDSQSEESDMDAYEAPEAVVQLSLFGSSLPPIKIFDSYTGLLSTVWNADGSIINAHETNIIWRQFVNVIPLFNGMTLTNDMIGGFSLKVSGSSKTSILNRDAQSTMINDVSASLDTKLTLVNGNGVVGNLWHRLSASGSVVLDLDVDFYAEPYLFCAVVSQGPLQLKYASTKKTMSYYQRIDNGKPKQNKFSHTVITPPHCYALNRRSTEMCNEMFKHKE